MSRKQSVRPRAGKKADVERKRDERAARRALAKERRNRSGEEVDTEEFLSFGKQLQALGLRMREVPGDGNCLFRALGDQLEGHSRNHLKHRQDTVDYMIKHRCDFEPFVEDDVPFDKHVGNLSQAGTFAGNDAIVAFARNNQVNIVIHQLNNPLWHIRGSDKANVRELHIAYRYGEHYDSVRHTNDNAETPANLQTEMHSKDESNRKAKQKSNLTEDRQGDAVQKVRNATGCADAKLIVQSLEAESYNIESAIHVILQIEELKQIGGGADCTPEDQDLSSSARDCDRPERRSEEKPAKPVEDASEQRRVQEEKKDSQSHKVSNKQRKEQQRQQKKKRQEERHKQRVQEQRSNNTDNNQQPEGGDAGGSVTVVKAVAALNI